MFGDAGRDIIPGPGNEVVNLSIHRRFQIRERETVEAFIKLGARVHYDYEVANAGPKPPGPPGPFAWAARPAGAPWQGPHVHKSSDVPALYGRREKGRLVGLSTRLIS